MNLRQIIRKECACYFRTGPFAEPVYDWCETKDKVCVAFGEFQRCRYFEEGVLLAQPDAAAEYADLCERLSSQRDLGVSADTHMPRRRAVVPRKRVGRTKQVSAVTLSLFGG